MRDWDNFLFRNYASEITPSTYDSRGKLNPLEIFNQYGLFKNEAWERYFYNEEEYDFIEAEDFERYVVRPDGMDLETTDGRQQFENKVNNLIQDFPGMVVPEGEKFDFENFYMRWSLLHQKDTSRFEPERLEANYQEIKHLIGSEEDTSKAMKFLGEEQAVGKNTVGLEMPDRLNERERHALQN